jgi:hypothetical protein
VNLALAIVFLWAGCALLTVAFHPLHTQDYTADAAGHVQGPTTLVKSVKSSIGALPSAYSAQ